MVQDVIWVAGSIESSVLVIKWSDIGFAMGKRDGVVEIIISVDKVVLSTVHSIKYRRLINRREYNSRICIKWLNWQKNALLIYRDTLNLIDLYHISWLQSDLYWLRRQIVWINQTQIQWTIYVLFHPLPFRSLSFVTITPDLWQTAHFCVRPSRSPCDQPITQARRRVPKPPISFLRFQQAILPGVWSFLSNLNSF